MPRSPSAPAALLLAALGACSTPPINDAPDEAPRGLAAPRLEPTPSVCPDQAPAPEALPGVAPRHRTAEFWIERARAYGDPDAVLLSPAEVADHNRALRAGGDRLPFADTDLLAPIDRAALMGDLAGRFEKLRGQLADGTYVRGDGSPAVLGDLDASILERAFAPSLHVALGHVQMHCSPDATGYYTPALDQRFDRNLCSAARAQEPVQVVGTWPNGMRYVRTRYSSGWIDREAKLSPAIPEPLREAFVRGPRAQALRALDLPGAAIGEGTTLPLDAEGGVHYATADGFRQSGALDAAAVRPTARPLTRRAFIEEAFRYLDTPYGWGGMGGGRDCSRFVMDLLATFGLTLPRHTASQARAGTFHLDLSTVTSEPERLLLIEAAARRGVVLLHFPGHIMVYLGRNEDGAPMAIHSFAEYLVPCAERDPGRPEAKETLLTVDRVRVTDLELGRDTSRTAFIERITHVTVLGQAPDVELAGAATLRPPAPAEVPATCRDGDFALFNSPWKPVAGKPLRVIATGTRSPGPVELTLIDPDGQRHTPEPRVLGGPPYTWVAEVPDPQPGKWVAVLGDGARTEGCLTMRVRSRPDKPDAPSQYVWAPRNTWNEATENFYAAFVEALFDYPPEEDLTWPNLHSLVRNAEKNILFDHLGQGEDDGLVLDPDCADLPYLLRAYFAWKVGLPYGYRSCSRGKAGRPPRCGGLQSNLEARNGADDAAAFQHFARRRVRNFVHSASGRTHPDDDETDFYPVPLTREALRPGTLYADPHGHMLVVARWLPQRVGRYGTLMAADSQPDGTISRRRFWRGSFLFTPETRDVGAGFKAFRPVVVEGGEARALTNAELKAPRDFPPYSRQQYSIGKDDFYGLMEGLINPRPLDPLALQASLIDALEEAVLHRVVSVQNGEDWKRRNSGRTIDMPKGYAVFETTGPWEDFSTPARDMRLLISIDTVLGLPDAIRRDPARFGLESPDAAAGVIARVEQVRDAELPKRRFEYTRSDGSKWPLTLADVVARRERFELSYNPNDCVEWRWAAREGDPDYATCRQRAPEAHQARAKEYRKWFAGRERPPR